MYYVLQCTYCRPHTDHMTTASAPVAINAGGHRARVLSRRDGLVNEHLEMARSIAIQIYTGLPAGFDLEDLIQIGCLGLIEAATRFRPRQHKGVPFSAYARPRIRGMILDAVRGHNYELATAPGLEGVAEPAAESEVEVRMDSATITVTVTRALAVLTPRQAAVIRKYYEGADGGRKDRTTCADIAQEMGLSRSTVQTIRRDAIEMLRRKATPLLREVA